MSRLGKIIYAIDSKILEVGVESIDYSEEKENRFKYNIVTYIESKNNILYFTFDAYDCGSGFHINNLKFDEDNDNLKNLVNFLNKATFRYE